MNLKYITTLALFVCVLIPATSSAYKTTGQTVQQINSTTALYSITYSFGHAKYDLYLPIVAQRNLEHGSQGKKLGFEVLNNDEMRTDNATAMALAISGAPIVDGMYKIKKGTAQKFTFYTILTTNPTDEKERYAVRVTDLPFYFDDERTPQSLNVSELQYYLTPESTFNKN